MRLRIQPRFYVIAIAVMTAVFTVSIAAAQHDLRQGALKLNQVTAQRAALQTEMKGLEQRLEYVQTDDYVIRVARDELGMVMPGEIRYISGN